MNERDLCRLFERVGVQEPDMVCFGGDLINTREREILLLRKPLGLIKPPLGIFAVPGNHDHFFGRDIGLWEAFLRDQGVHVLMNRGMRIERDGSSMWIAGVDDLTESEPDLARANFFFARVLRDEGNFDQALEHLGRVTAGYPRDRVVWNEIGRIRFLQRRYEDAVVALRRVLEIDPEDLMAHYNLMLSYSGLNDEDRAVEHQQFYLRFKADESAQAITGRYLREHPEDNLERQPIHEHGSAESSDANQKTGTAE